jgi:hypothetical protein
MVQGSRMITVMGAVIWRTWAVKDLIMILKRAGSQGIRRVGSALIGDRVCSEGEESGTIESEWSKYAT